MRSPARRGLLLCLVAAAGFGAARTSRALTAQLPYGELTCDCWSARHAALAGLTKYGEER